MVRKDRESKKTVHINKELHKIVELYKAERDISSIEKAVDKLIRAGFEGKREELPDYIIKKIKEL